MKEKIIEILNKANPEIVKELNQGKAVPVMLSQRTIDNLVDIELSDVPLDKKLNEVLSIKRTGGISMGRGNRVGNAINDLREGYMEGFILKFI